MVGPARAVVGDKQSHVRIQDQEQVAVEQLRVAAVRDDAMAVHVLFVETQGHCVHAGGPACLPRVHLHRGLWVENLHVAVAAVLQMHNHPVRHGFGGGGEGSGGSDFHPLEVLGLAGTEVVTVGHERLKRFRQGLTKCGAVHVERLEEMFVHIIVERLAGNALDRIRGKGRGVVRVGWNCTRRENLLRQMRRQILGHRRQQFLIADKKVLDGFFETRAMGHDVAEGRGFAEGRRNLEVQILVYVHIQI